MPQVHAHAGWPRALRGNLRYLHNHELASGVAFPSKALLGNFRAASSIPHPSMASTCGKQSNF